MLRGVRAIAFVAVLGLLCTLIAYPAYAVRGTQAAGVELYVSAQTGDDAWSGKQPGPNAAKTDGPFATLDRARDAIRELRQHGPLPVGGVDVFISGDVDLNQSFALIAIDSGTAEAPIRYLGTPKAKPHITGGKAVRDFGPIFDATIVSRLNEEARTHVVQVDLKAAGIADLGQITAIGQTVGGAQTFAELFFNGERMTLARWPNQRWAKIAAVPAGQMSDRFTYDGDRPATWHNTGEIWLHGYWTYEWADSYVRVADINAATHEFITAKPYGAYGYTADRRYFALNVLEELDEPGEYYMDRPRGMLYFWPPSDPTKAEVCVSVVDTPLISMQGVSHVQISGLTLEYGRGSGISATGVRSVTIDGCELRNLNGYGITLNGIESTVANCDIHDTGLGGVEVSGGDRMTLAPSGNKVVNNHIHDYSKIQFTYQAGIKMYGVGQTAANNLIEEAPHNGILFGGNDNIIERNEVRRVCLETGDAGAIYIGRDWTERGSVVRYNYIHDLGALDTNAIYFDDCASGMQIVGNVCANLKRAILIGGGRDNLIKGNIFFNCTPAVHVDARGTAWASFWFNGKDNTLYDRLKAVNGTQPPYTLRYPQLATITTDEPALPKGTVIENNIFFKGQWLDLLDGLDDKTIKFSDNWTEGDPCFVDPSKGDFKLKANSPLRKASWFQVPDMKAIGIQN